MIRTLRNSGIGQIFLGAIVVSIMLAFVLTGTSSTPGMDGDECVVEVGKDCISPKEFFASYGLLSAIGGGGINEAAASRFRLKEQVARGLAERTVLLKEARRLGLATSEKDIDDELVQGRTRVSLPAQDQLRLAASLGMCIPGPGGCEPGTAGLRALAVTRDGAFDFETYKRSVRIWTKRSLAQFKEMQAREYTAERVRQLVRSQVRVSPEEAFLAYSRVRSQATARTVEVPTAWFQRYVTNPSDEQLATFATEHAEEIKSTVESLSTTWKDGCAIVSELVVENSDPDSERSAEKKSQAEKLRQAASNAQDFHALARRQSEAPSAALGGRVGCLDESYGAGAAVLMEAAGALTRPGQISPVVETIRGFVVLRLEERVNAENKQALVEQFVVQKLASAELAKKDAEAFSQGLIATAKTKTLEEALNSELDRVLPDAEHPARAAQDAPRVEISRAVSIEEDPFTGAAGEVPPSVTLFALENEDDLAPAPIPTNTGFVVMQLKSKDLLTKEEFEEDRETVLATLRARKAQEALATYVAELIKKDGGIKLNEKYVPPAEDESTQTEKDS